jgi:hypothetical protein
MAEAGEPHGQGAADVAGANDSDVHSSVVLVCAAAKCRRREINNASGGFAFLGGALEQETPPERGSGGVELCVMGGV